LSTPQSSLHSAFTVLRERGRELRTAPEVEIKAPERTSPLPRSERELRDLVDIIPAMVWSALPDGSNAYVNSRFVEYSGMSAEQLAGSGWRIRGSHGIRVIHGIGTTAHRRFYLFSQTYEWQEYCSLLDRSRDAQRSRHNRREEQ